MLQQPNHPQTTAAVPKLVAETLKAQSADIDTVSGATITSNAYKKSLQAAIDSTRRTRGVRSSSGPPPRLGADRDRPDGEHREGRRAGPGDLRRRRRSPP